MTEHERLRDLLEQAAPADPDLSPGERSAAVARRGRAARLRDRLAVAGVAATVLAVAVAVPLSLRGNDDGPDTAGPPAPTAAPCPAAPVDVTAVPEVPWLPDLKVVSARICPATFTPEGGAAVLTTTEDPTTPLTGPFATDFAADVMGIEEFVAGERCAAMMVAPDPWSVVVTTKSGRTIVIGSTTRVCGSSEISGAGRGSEEVLAAFAGNLGRQEVGDRRPASAGLSCPTGESLAEGADTWNFSFDLNEVVAGVVCYREDPLGSRTYAQTSGTLGRQQVATLQEGVDVYRNNPARGCADTGPQRLLLLADAAGDRVAYLDDDCTGMFLGPGGSWQLDRAGEQIVTEALGGRT